MSDDNYKGGPIPTVETIRPAVGEAGIYLEMTLRLPGLPGEVLRETQQVLCRRALCHEFLEALQGAAADWDRLHGQHPRRRR